MQVQPRARSAARGASQPHLPPALRPPFTLTHPCYCLRDCDPACLMKPVRPGLAHTNHATLRGPCQGAPPQALRSLLPGLCLLRARVSGHRGPPCSQQASTGRAAAGARTAHEPPAGGRWPRPPPACLSLFPPSGMPSHLPPAPETTPRPPRSSSNPSFSLTPSFTLLDSSPFLIS